ncbi:MAG: hypothetical protein ACOYVF_07515 [Candidatus Zixiibacteriota bacterium]
MKFTYHFLAPVMVLIVFVLIFSAVQICAETLSTDCPGNAVFSQPPHYPEDVSTAQSSDAGSTFDPGIIYDNFSGTTGITGVHFWGFTGYIDYGYYHCDENPMTFEICFYIDSLNHPGHQVACYTMVIESMPTGLIYYGMDELLEYETELPTVEMTEGWVSIEGKDGSDLCWFFWLSSRDGMDSGSFKYGAGTTHFNVDFAFCLLEESTCCTGFTGNVNCSVDDNPDISDITRLIDFLYLSHASLCCADEADVNGSGGDPDISDITRLIDFLYLSGTPLPDCP